MNENDPSLSSKSPLTAEELIERIASTMTISLLEEVDRRLETHTEQLLSVIHSELDTIRKDLSERLVTRSWVADYLNEAMRGQQEGTGQAAEKASDAVPVNLKQFSQQPQLVDEHLHQLQSSLEIFVNRKIEVFKSRFPYPDQVATKEWVNSLFSDLDHSPTSMTKPSGQTTPEDQDSHDMELVQPQIIDEKLKQEETIVKVVLDEDPDNEIEATASA